MNIIDFLNARIAEDEALAQAATPGPWEWWNLEGVDQGAGDQGPNLNHHTGQWETCKYHCTWKEPTTTSRGEIGKPGHGHLKTEPVVSSWGHDWNGVSIEKADAEHIARHDPARTLAECKAKRAIIAMWPDDDDYVHIGDWESCTDSCPPIIAMQAIKAIAAAYSTHPDYQKEWAP